MAAKPTKTADELRALVIERLKQIPEFASEMASNPSYTDALGMPWLAPARSAQGRNWILDKRPSGSQDGRQDIEDAINALGDEYDLQE